MSCFSPKFCSSFEEQSVDTAVREVYRVAAYLRQEMMSMQSKVALPPDPTQLAEESFPIPSILHNFLAWTLRGDSIK